MSTAALSGAVQRARAVERRNAAALSEREADRRQVERLSEQVRRLAEQYEQERKEHIELMSILGEHIKHVGKLTANYKALTDDLTELWQ